MAEVSTVVQQPPEFIEAAAKPYITQLQQVTGGLKEADLSQVYGPQFTAGLGALTQQAIGQAGGLGAYEPYLQAAQAATGPTAYQQYMSPYQQDVIGTTLAEFDVQAQKGLPQLAAQAIGAGAFGGGREGVQRAEYQTASDRNRAALQAQLLQQGFGQAQQLAGQAFGQQMNLAQAAPAFASQQIAGLSTLGGLQQAQTQAGLAAQQQLAQAQAQQPIQAAQTLGSGIMGLISGYPGQIQQTVQPTPSPLQTALSTGATLAGLYKGFSDL
jgi:hypothetical protein